jgi:hypothetical protein
MRFIGVEHERFAVSTRSAAVVLTLTLIAACGGDESTSPSPQGAGNVAAGRTAFVASCASCHASRDGFDLAVFGFDDATIVRRALAHVNQQTADNIAAYVRSLGVPSVGRAGAPFQPGGGRSGTDEEFWTALFADVDVGQTLTADRIRAVDLRKLVVPIKLLSWSVDIDDNDWMPELPLPSEILNANNGAVRLAIDAYYATPTTDRLVAAIRAFRGSSTAGSNAVCAGITGAHTRPGPCFEARRWMSSLAGVHLLRNGQTESPPIEVVDLWWETGEVAVSLFFSRGASPERHPMVYGWLYLAFTYAPHRFAEENGYLGQFLQSAGFPRVGAFAALRRMVEPGVARNNLDEVPVHQFWDAHLAVTRAPSALRLDIYRFAVRYLDSWLGTATLTPAGRTFATQLVNLDYDAVTRGVSLSSDVRTELTASRDRLLARLAER